MAITKKPFGTLPDGRETFLYTMTNAKGASVSLLSYGGMVTSICVPDRDGVLADVALGFDTLDKYLVDHGCIGDLVGRCGNRIGLGRFTLDGQTVQAGCNDGRNSLHGGFKGFSSKLWDVTPQEGDGADALLLAYTSPDGEEGFPGTLSVTVRYAWDDENRLSIRYRATTDKTTVCNLTDHTYFNLAGHDHGTIADHVLQIEGDAITPVSNSELIPTGEYMSVVGTPFDMRSGLLLGDGLAHTQENTQMRYAGGYDHNYVLRKGCTFGLAARLTHPQSGRVLEVVTDQPGVQLYTGCCCKYGGGKGGAYYGQYSALCLETQHFPDSPNNPQFISTVTLRPGEVYDTTTIYAFSVV